MVSRRRAEKQFELEEQRHRLPQEGDPLPRVELRVDRHSRHPWIFRRMLREPSAPVEPGQLVEVVARDGRFAGRGFYNANSEIALRVLADDPAVFPARRGSASASPRPSASATTPSASPPGPTPTASSTPRPTG
jgi:hypothetical protein